MTQSVHIKIADSGWILEKCAKEIANRAADVSYGLDADPSAELQYYINYSGRTRRVSPVEVAFFTHSEKDANARRRYFDAAAEVDHCVCMSSKYARELIESGIPADKVTIIAPGVDLDEFRPKVRVGVIGRTYHTGRKGEGLVAQLMDVPDIEWRFTGSGWPGPSTHVPNGSMADFYNDLDYVLVPALYEGGPMSVLEGLACGVPIISSDVGWANEYPHIPFENGNVDSLRQVLTNLVAERQALRSSVRDRTWEAWAKEHLALFARLLGADRKEGAPAVKRADVIQATLVTHGTETKSIGGPSVRVPRTAAELAKLNVNAAMPTDQPDNFSTAPIAHVFNIWPADSCFKQLDRAHAVGKRTVLSPIFLNLSNIQFAAKSYPKLFGEGRSDESIDASLAEIAREVGEEPNLPIREPFEGFHERVRACVEAADEVVFLSEYERRCLEHIGAVPQSGTLIRNPVDASAFAGANPALFADHFGLSDYILCVGRIEPRKNQLTLAHAAKTMGKKVVFIGHTEDVPYMDLVREVAGDAGHFISRIEPSNPLLKSAFAGASVFCLPSWAEGAPLAALEAAGAGLPLVLSDRSSEQEYFGDFAEYVNPADIDGMRAALETAAAKRSDEGRRAALQKHVAEHNSWEKYAAETKSVYEKVLKSKPSRPAPTEPENNKIYFDLTTTFHSSGNPTGIARVENRALRALVAKYRDRIVPIMWNGRTQGFLEVSRAAALVGVRAADLERLEREGSAKPIVHDELRGGRILVLGGAWIRNPQYIAALRAIKSELGANLTLLVHDLIQMKLSHLYPEGVGGEFERNASLMTDEADDFLVYSDCTRRDLREFLLQKGELFKKISKFRLGDMTGLHHEDDSGPASELQERFANKRFAVYVSTVEIRKNHALLINVWRRLIEERGSATPQLLFIGRSLWRGDEVVDSIRRDEKLRPYVHVLEDVDDADLDWFYRHCLFTVYPSLYEGWGLPVAESLSYGKICITSDRTATREIAPDLTDLADPYDFRAWRDRVAYYLDNPAALERAEAKIRENYQEHSWDQSVQEIVSSLDIIAPAAVEPAILFPGELVEFYTAARSTKGTAICAGGWANIEGGGRWSIGERSTLSFRFPTSADSFQMRLSLRALTRSPEEVRSFRLLANGQEQVVEISGVPTVIEVTVPVTRTDGKRLSENELVFEPLQLISPNALTGSTDTRRLGVYLIAAQAAEDLSELAAPPVAPPPPPQSDASPPSPVPLQKARELVVLPARFTGKKPMARLFRALGFDKIWLKMHARQFKRTYSSLNLILDYLQAQKR